ncbi:hypothetical protein Tco_0594041, partial [Tanacetum coccineum]
MRHVLDTLPLKQIRQDITIVAEHELSSEITQSLGGSSDTSERYENSGSFEDSGRSDEEYSEDRASSGEGGSETTQVRRSSKESRDRSEKSRIVAKAQKRGFQLAGQEESLEFKLKEIMYELIQAPSWAKLVQVLISEGSLSLLKILGTKSLAEMFTSNYCWSLEGSQEFSVKSFRILIDNTILPKAEVPTRWLRVVPIKPNNNMGIEEWGRRNIIFCSSFQMENEDVDQQLGDGDRHIVLTIQGGLFNPSNNLTSTITSIWKSRFTRAWDNWTIVPAEDKEIWFNSFK